LDHQEDVIKSLEGRLRAKELSTSESLDSDKFAKEALVLQQQIKDFV
jgi:hypothetical protein